MAGTVGPTESGTGRFFWELLLKNEPFFLPLFMRVFLLSARCSTAADSARVEAAVLTVLRRSSGSIDLSSSSSVTSSSVAGRLRNMAQREGGCRGVERVWVEREGEGGGRCGRDEEETENSSAQKRRGRIALGSRSSSASLVRTCVGLTNCHLRFGILLQA